MSVLPAYMSVQNLFAVLTEARRAEDTRCPGTKVTDHSELPYGCWELNPIPLEKQQVLLTSEPFLLAQQLSILSLFLDLQNDFNPLVFTVEVNKYAFGIS